MLLTVLVFYIQLVLIILFNFYFKVLRIELGDCVEGKGESLAFVENFQGQTGSLDVINVASKIKPKYVVLFNRSLILTRQLEV